MKDEEYYNTQIRWLNSLADRLDQMGELAYSRHIETIAVDLKHILARCKALEEIILELTMNKQEDDGK